jgi:hypothetical protein
MILRGAQDVCSEANEITSGGMGLLSQHLSQQLNTNLSQYRRAPSSARSSPSSSSRILSATVMNLSAIS